MRDDLRRTCSEIWVIDCSPEGHQPEVATRIFQGVQQPVCVVLAARKLGKNSDAPAPVWFRALPQGRREQKFDALAELSLNQPGWAICPSRWRDPFLPAATGLWADFPEIKNCFVFAGPGVMPGRTWVVAPDKESLGKRWARLGGEKKAEGKGIFFHVQYRKSQVPNGPIRKKVQQDLGAITTRHESILEDHGECLDAVRYGFRSFDRQWVIADPRPLNYPSPVLCSPSSPNPVVI